MCPKAFSRKDRFKYHQLQHNNSEFVCITCRKKFKTEWALAKHLEYGKYCSLQCEKCTKTFTQKHDLVKHVKICNKVDDDSGGTCDICFEAFEFRIDLERHRKSSTNPDGSLRFPCGYCEEKNCSFEMLGTHIQSEHKKKRDEKLRNYCEEKRRQGKPLLPDKVFPCEKCGKTFMSKDIMINHLETHIAKPSEIFYCNICHTKFTLRKNYLRHIKEIYDGENPRHLCEVCGDLFCTGKLLKKHHNEVHKEVISCPICDQIFTTKMALQRHTNHLSAFNCGECGKQFCNKKTFCVHMKYVHLKFVDIHFKL